MTPPPHLTRRSGPCLTPWRSGGSVGDCAAGRSRANTMSATGRRQTDHGIYARWLARMTTSQGIVRLTLRAAQCWDAPSDDPATFGASAINCWCPGGFLFVFHTSVRLCTYRRKPAVGKDQTASRPSVLRRGYPTGSNPLESMRNGRGPLNLGRQGACRRGHDTRARLSSGGSRTAGPGPRATGRTGRPLWRVPPPARRDASTPFPSRAQPSGAGGIPGRLSGSPTASDVSALLA